MLANFKIKIYFIYNFFFFFQGVRKKDLNELDLTGQGVNDEMIRWKRREGGSMSLDIHVRIMKTKEQSGPALAEDWAHR